LQKEDQGRGKWIEKEALGVNFRGKQDQTGGRNLHKLRLRKLRQLIPRCRKDRFYNVGISVKKRRERERRKTVQSVKIANTNG